MTRKILAIFISISLTVLWPSAGFSQRSISLLRDAETENIIRAWVTPLFDAAGLESDALTIYIVNDNSLNAFVMGGQNIFIHTGLLLAAQRPSQVIGVLAHETGHITGGHLSRFADGTKSASAVSLITILAGIAAIAVGAGDAGAALLGSSGTFAQRAFFKYTRVQESSADQAAMVLLEASGQSSQGLVEFFERLIVMENKITTNRDPYIRSHPLNRDRINSIINGSRDSVYWDKPDKPEFVEMHKRMQAKLRGYLFDPEQTFNIYPTTDQSLYARYARAMAYHKMAELDLALAETNSLLDDAPKDAYFYELKGQILFESGKTKDAVVPYRKAVKYAPSETLLRVSLAQSIIASEDMSLNGEAITQLMVANQRDPYNSFAWHQLAIAYNRDGRREMADLATAERYLLVGRFREAAVLAQRASGQIAEDTPSWWQSQDIINLASQIIEDQGRRGRNRFRD